MTELTTNTEAAALRPVQYQINLYLAFGVAMLAHAAVLTIKFSVPMLMPATNDSSELFVRFQKQLEPEISYVEKPDAELPEAIPIDSVEPDEKLKPSPPQMSTEPSISVEVITDNQQPKNAQVSVTMFSRWYQSEQKNNGIDDSATVQRFSNTFIETVPEVEPDIKYEEGRLGPMGGGSYKIRKDGVTCDQLTMAPLTFDDLQYGTSTVIDNCTQDEKMKIDIHRLNK